MEAALKGKTVDEAKAYLEQTEVTMQSPLGGAIRVNEVRCIKADGQMFPMTRDMRPSRCNVVTEGGKITTVQGFS